MKKSLKVLALPGYDPEIGRWLWALEDVRRTIIERLNGISQDTLDRKIENKTVGSLLYHIALIEADWFYVEVLRTDFDPEIKQLFPEEARTEDGSLATVSGQSLEEHFHRLTAVRQKLLSRFMNMDLQDFRRPRQLEQYDVSPEWVIYHLIEHEAHHRGQIFQMLNQA
ncbi:DinB family protein [Peribacillus sp. SCS-155]|uniref:DinB family protein n=1 Tax=Peribacillus sedimenti TaxID=3115297 RepID=UPI00390577B8